MDEHSSRGSRHAIVLAGGEGTRLNPLVTEWLGEPRPKQFCTFVGTRSMLEHTWDRALELVGPQRILTVITKGQAGYLETAVGSAPSVGELIEQPRARGTAPAVFVALAHVLARDPDATIILLPADHFVCPEAAFVEQAERALTLASRLEDRYALLGVRPDRPESEYGWILRGDRVDTGDGLQGRQPQARVVTSFCEKPDVERAARYGDDGGLWNTMIVAARARTLWELARPVLSRTMAYFDAYLAVCQELASADVPLTGAGPSRERLYARLHSADFSRDFVEPTTRNAVAVELAGVLWSDWGRPERIVESLERIGKRPRFELGYARASGVGDDRASGGPAVRPRDAERLPAIRHDGLGLGAAVQAIATD